MNEQKNRMDDNAQKEPVKKYPPATLEDTVQAKHLTKDTVELYTRYPSNLFKITCRLTFTNGQLATFPLNLNSSGPVDKNAGKTLDEYAKLCTHTKGIPHEDAVNEVRARDKKVFFRNDAMEVCIQGYQIHGFLNEADKRLLPGSPLHIQNGVKNISIKDTEGNASTNIPIRRKGGSKILSSDYTGIADHRDHKRSWDAPREFAPPGSYIECNLIFMDIPGLGERIEQILRDGAEHGIGGGRSSGKGVFTVKMLNPC